MKLRTKALRAFAAQLAEESSFEEGMYFISDALKKFIPAERASIFIYNAKEGRLESRHADGGVDPISIPSDIGLIGECIRSKKSVLENEPYGNPNFLADIDMQTGFYTQNVLSTPVFNTQEEIIAVLQLLNRKGGFSRKERTLIELFSETVRSYIEQNTQH